MKLANPRLILILILTAMSGSTLEAKDKLNYPLNGDPEVQQYMACFENFYLTRPEVIISKLAEYVTTHPQSDLADEALLKAGELAEKLGKYDEALTYYYKVSSEYPLAKKLEERFLWRNYISEVEIPYINELYQYYEKNPTYSSDLALLKTANCLKIQGKIEPAIETLKSLIAKYPDGLWEEEDQARIQNLGQSQILSVYAPDWRRPHREAYLFLAKFYQEEGEIDQTIEITTQFLEKFKNLSLFWEVKNSLADLYAEKKEFAKAREILEKTLLEIPAQKNLQSQEVERLEKIIQKKIDQLKVQ